MVRMTVDTSDVEDYERRLNRYTRHGHAFAMRNTLNDLAFYTMRRGRHYVKENFLNRNRWTERSVQARKARGIDVNRMFSEAGSVEDYMADQEFGGIRRPHHGRTASIPSTSAAGQSISNIPRKRTVRRANRLDQIKLKSKRYERKTRGMREKQRAVVTMAIARREGEKFVYLQLPWGKRAKGIFRLMGSRRNPKIRLIHDMSRRYVVIKKRPWLNPATDDALKRGNKFYVRQARRQLRRAQLL